MILGDDGATAIAPTADVVKYPSETMSQSAPPLVVFHTPPAQPPKYNVPGSVGCPATATTRPPRCGPIQRHESDRKYLSSMLLSSIALSVFDARQHGMMAF